MKRLILITGLLVALLGLIRSVDAETVVGYGSNAAGEIHLIDLERATKIPLSSFSTGFGMFQGLAIDPSGETLYGLDQNGLFYNIDIVTETTMFIDDMSLGTVEAMDFNFNGTEFWVTDFDSSPSKDFQSIDPDPLTDQLSLIGDTDEKTDPMFDGSRDDGNYASPYK